MTLIDLENVGLTFRVRKHGRITFKEYMLSGMFRRRDGATMEVEALKNIDLQLGEGDRVGIIGHNGAGKSTLLRVLAGVYPPTTGTRVVNGRIASLFEISLGFEMDASGWENIAFRSYIQGESPRSVREKMQEIAEFSELGDFLNMSLRYYSAGMLVRLAFSIATTVEPEILIVDEVLSAGDLSFQSKARARMQQLLAHARVVVMVSHDLGAITSLCERVLWMDHGRIRKFGQAAEVVKAYQHHTQQQTAQAA